MALTTQLETYLYCFETPDVRIVCPVSERSFRSYVDIVTPFGLPGFVGTDEYEDVAIHWGDFAAQRGYVCGYFGLNPLFGRESYHKGSIPTAYNSVYILDLTLSISELYFNLNANRRRELRHWEDINSNLILDREMLSAFLIRNYPAHLQRVGATASYHFSSETLLALAYSDQVLLVGAGSATDVEAVYLFPYTAYAAEWMLLVTTATGRRHTAKLLWYAIHQFKSKNIPILNLGGGVKEDDSVAQAKQRYGAKRIPTKALKQIYDAEVYSMLCQQAGVEHMSDGGYFPAYRRP